MSLDFEGQEWRRYARCTSIALADPDFFFPGKGDSYVHAKEFCAPCPVKSDCILAAITTNERYGIWGGMGERARRKVKHLLQKGWSLGDAIDRIESAPNQRVKD